MEKLRSNVGPADRFAMVLIGLVVLALGWFASNGLGWVGLFPIISGVTRLYPGHRPFDRDRSRSVSGAEAVG